MIRRFQPIAARPVSRTTLPSELGLSARAEEIASTLPVSQIAAERRQFFAQTHAGGLFPNEAWRRCIRHHVHQTETSAAVPGGHLRLRQAIADFLWGYRGVRADLDQIIVTSGVTQALDQCARLLVDAGDRVAMESPSPPNFRSIFRFAGAHIVPLDVGDAGIDRSVLSHQGADLRAILVTPANQNPLGHAFPDADRLELLDVSSRHRVWIIEYDRGEYLGLRRPLYAQTQESGVGHVVLVGSFAHILSQNLGIGFIVAPTAIASAFRHARYVMDLHPPMFIQQALAQFIEDGQLNRHLDRIRKLYRRRFRELHRSVEETLGAHLRPLPHDAVLRLATLARHNIDDVQISRAAGEVGVQLEPLSQYYFGSRTAKGFLLGYGAGGEASMRIALRKLEPFFPRGFQDCRIV
ncbi:MAG: PLP-dependent aminotransferase family protein [Pseudomonadota bacterium]